MCSSVQQGIYASQYTKISRKGFAQIGVFRAVVKAERTNMVKTSGEPPGKALAEICCTDGLLLLDKLLLLLLIRGLETLPWETGVRC